MTKKGECHCITIYPSMKFGQPCVDHHRITAEHMAMVWWSGNYELKYLEDNWPGMSRGAVLVACWYMARYGTRMWRKRWKDWLYVAETELWYSRYDTCPMPPQQADERAEIEHGANTP